MTPSQPFRLEKITQLIAEAAQRRGIHVRAFPDISTKVVVLQYGSHEELISETATSKLSAVVRKLLFNKTLTSVLLRDWGYRVPRQLLTDQLGEACQFLREQGRIVVKPNNLMRGLGVTTGITSEEELEVAFGLAQSIRSESRAAEQQVICQEHLEGDEYRVLFVDPHVFGLRRVPARLTGDGEHTVSELLARRNAQHEVPITFDDLARHVLKPRLVTPQTVLAAGESVPLAAAANAHAATTEDVTDLIGDAVRESGYRLARQLGLPLLAIDCFAQDLGKDLGCIIELNPTPGILRHHTPHLGRGRDVAGAMLDMLFPETSSCGEVPHLTA